MPTDATPAGRPSHQPTHPGALLREDVLPALALPVSRAAEALGVSRQALHAILAERASVTPEMAMRLGKLCGNGAGLWLRMQQAHDLYRLEAEMALQLAAIHTMRRYNPQTGQRRRPRVEVRKGGEITVYVSEKPVAPAKSALTEPAETEPRIRPSEKSKRGGGTSRQV